MRKYRLILLFIAVHNIIQAQTPRIDSLRGELGKQKADSIKVHDRIRISWYLADMRDSAQAWKYRNEADSIANKTNNPVLKGIVLEHTGFLYNRQFSKKAISYYLEAQHILKNYPNSMAAKKSMASLGLNIGIEHMNVNDDAGALPYYFDAVQRYDAMDTNSNNLPLLYGNIINSYYNLGKYESALSYCEKAYKKSMAGSNATAKMSASMNYGRVLLKLNRIPESDFYFGVGKKIADSLNSYYFQSKYYQVLGDDAFNKEQFEKALGYFSAALPVIKLTNAPYDIAACYIWMGACNAGIKKFEPAKKYLDSAYLITKQYEYTNLLKDVYLNRYHLYKKAGQYHEAIIQLDSFNVINDSLQLAANADKLQFLDAKYQAEKKKRRSINCRRIKRYKGLTWKERMR
ncbi:tetratricopeptide repeat protein [Ferruginibacter sp.]